MKELLLNFSIGIVSGTAAGLLSSMIMYLFSERRAKTRKIIEYAEQIAEKAYLIMDEARECSEGKSFDQLKQLMRKEVRRTFPGNIVDKTTLSQNLQNAIALCNHKISEIQEILDSSGGDSIYNQLFHASGELNDALIDIWNATTEYDTSEDRRINRFTKQFKIWIPAIILLFVCIMIFALVWN